MTIIGVRDLFCFRDKRLENLRERISNSQATLKDPHFLRKYGIDSRSIRLPAVMGLGAKTKNISLYNAWAIEKSFSGEPYEIFVRSETAAPIIYFKDAARAFLEISRAPADHIKTMNYILAGVEPMPTAGDLKNTILHHLPQAQLTFRPDTLAMAFQKMNQDVRWDETPAVREWNWKIKYSLDDMVKDFIRELTHHPSWYISEDRANPNLTRTIGWAILT